MRRILAVLTLMALLVVALAVPAFARGATQISGVGFLPDEQTCNDPERVNAEGEVANYALILDGDLKGCLYTFIETAKSSPSGTYRETGTEVFVASDGSGTFKTTYRFEAKYEDVDNPATEIFGRCQHPIVKGSGTGIFEGVTGRLDFKDDIEAGNFPYRGHLRW
jgi:hypothetical protein